MSFTIAALFLSLAQNPDPAALKQLVEGHLASSGVPGAVVAFVVDGKPDAVHAFGLADLASGRKMTPQTRFQVGSVTKPVTTALLARLQAKGVLSLDDPLSKHVDVPATLASITLRELAQHRSGLPREAINRRDLPDSPSVMIPMSNEELLEGLAKTPRSGEVVEASYSNLGFAVLGLVASEAADGGYERLVAQHVLQPLGMSASGVYVDEATPDGLASCYWPEDEEPIARAPWRFGSACAFSGLVSTAGDLARFLAAQLDREDTFLSNALREELRRPTQAPDPQSGLAPATGWFVANLPGGLQAIAHGGEVDGHSSMIAFFPKLNTGIVILCNRGGDSAEMLSRNVMGLALQAWMQRQ